MKVPISLVYRQDSVCAGPNRFLLYAYGAYGSPEDPAFDRNLISLLDRCIANLTHRLPLALLLCERVLGVGARA